MSEVLWVDRHSGLECKISEMCTSHLKNTSRYLKKQIKHFKLLESHSTWCGECRSTCFRLENDQKLLNRVIRCRENKKKLMDTELMRRLEDDHE